MPFTIAPDKRAHAKVSLAMALAFGLVCAITAHPPWWGALLAFALGLAREVAQYVTTHSILARTWADEWRLTRWAMLGDAEWGDALWDGIGTLGGWAFLSLCVGSWW